jgi:hypothetical protein
MLENPSRDTKGEIKEWIKQVEVLMKEKIDIPDDQMHEAKSESQEQINAYNLKLKQKKEIDLAMDFSASSMDNNLLNSAREAEKNDDDDDNEKSFYLTSHILTKEWGKDFES